MKQIDCHRLINDEKWRKQFDHYQLTEISTGLAVGLDVGVYAKPHLTSDVMEELRIGMLCGHDMSPYTNGDYDWEQIFEIRVGLSYEIDVTQYHSPHLTADQMEAKRERLLKERIYGLGCQLGALLDKKEYGSETTRL